MTRPTTEITGGDGRRQVGKDDYRQQDDGRRPSSGPIKVIVDLLRVPAADRYQFHRGSNRLVSMPSPRDLLLGILAAWLFMRYLRRLVAWRRTQPGDDLLIALFQAEDAGDRLSPDELLAMLSSCCWSPVTKRRSTSLPAEPWPCWSTPTSSTAHAASLA